MNDEHGLPLFFLSFSFYILAKCQKINKIKAFFLEPAKKAINKKTQKTRERDRIWVKFEEYETAK